MASVAPHVYRTTVLALFFQRALAIAPAPRNARQPPDLAPLIPPNRLPKRQALRVPLQHIDMKLLDPLRADSLHGMAHHLAANPSPAQLQPNR
jgi:hypothetical protein